MLDFITKKLTSIKNYFFSKGFIKPEVVVSEAEINQFLAKHGYSDRTQEKLREYEKELASNKSIINHLYLQTADQQRCLEEIGARKPYERIKFLESEVKDKDEEIDRLTKSNTSITELLNQLKENGNIPSLVKDQHEAIETLRKQQIESIEHSKFLREELNRKTEELAEVKKTQLFCKSQDEHEEKALSASGVNKLIMKDLLAQNKELVEKIGIMSHASLNNTEVVHLKNEVIELKRELFQATAKITELTESKTVLNDSHATELKNTKSTLNEKSFNQVTAKEKEITTLSEQVKVLEAKLEESKRLHEDFHTSLRNIKETKVPDIKDLETSVIIEKDTTIENLSDEIVRLKDNLLIQKGLVNQHFLDISLKLDTYIPSNRLHLFKSRTYAETLRGNFVKITDSLKDLSDKIILNHSKAISLHNEITSNAEESLKAQRYMLKEEAYLADREHILSRITDDKEKQKAMLEYNSVDTKFKEYQDFLLKLAEKKKDLQIQLLGLDKETKLNSQAYTYMLQEIHTELEHAKGEIHFPKSLFTETEYNNETLLISQERNQALVEVRQLTTKLSASQDDISKLKAEHLFKVKVLESNLANEQNHTKNLKMTICDLSSIMSKLNVSKEHETALHKYNSDCKLRREMLVEKLKECPDNKQIQTEIAMLGVIVKITPLISANTLKALHEDYSPKNTKPKLSHEQEELTKKTMGFLKPTSIDDTAASKQESLRIIETEANKPTLKAMKPLSNKNEPAPELTPSSMRKMTKSQTNYGPKLIIPDTKVSTLSKKFQPNPGSFIEIDAKEEKNTPNTDL